jgi:DNA-binding NarL/FixJ family response regulator
MSDEIRLLLVDDEWLVRSGLRSMLKGQPGISIVGEAADGTDVAELAVTSRADVILMDIRMPKMNGVEATKAVRALADPPEVIVLTTFENDALILKSLRAGSSGYLLKDTPPDELVRAIRRVAAGEPILSPSVLRKLILRFTEPAPEPPTSLALAKLTAAERRVALSVARGLSNREIGTQLSVSVATVKSHMSRILDKLHVKNRVQIALLLKEENKR